MPAPAIIASAAKSYRFNSDTLAKAVADLSTEEWFKSPAPNLNHAAWIVGHCMWTRQRLLSRLGSDWNQPNLDLYARGAKLADASAFPAPESMLSAWRESSAELDSVLNSLSEELLATPAPPGPPSDDGKISGIVNFLAVHETYHVGQASYLRSWLGKSALMG
jgi:uncharacterized damage-inducible protein DinB